MRTRPQTERATDSAFRRRPRPRGHSFLMPAPGLQGPVGVVLQTRHTAGSAERRMRRSVRLLSGPSFRSTGSADRSDAGGAVDPFADEVGVARMARVLLDHVDEDPAQVRLPVERLATIPVVQRGEIVEFVLGGDGT